LPVGSPERAKAVVEACEAASESGGFEASCAVLDQANADAEPELAKQAQAFDEEFAFIWDALFGEDEESDRAAQTLHAMLGSLVLYGYGLDPGKPGPTTVRLRDLPAQLRHERMRSFAATLREIRLLPVARSTARPREHRRRSSRTSRGSPSSDPDPEPPLDDAHLGGGAQ
jgi:hypothetical protein